MRPACAILLGTALFLTSAAAFADIAPPRQFGQSLSPGEATEVATTAEEVSYRVVYQAHYRPTLLGDRGFTYVLRTGAAWHGPIGKAVIDVHCGEGLTPEHLGGIELPGYEKTEDGVRWELTDLEPTQDIELYVRKFTDYEEAGRFYLEQAGKHTAGDDAKAAAQGHAAAAVCLWNTKQYEPCLESCRAVIAVEKLSSKTRGPGRSAGRSRITPTYRSPPEVWERWVVRCLMKLGRVEEARAAAPAAVEALKADLAQRVHYRHEHLEEFEARIARYEAFAAGGKFED